MSDEKGEEEVPTRLMRRVSTRLSGRCKIVVGCLSLRFPDLINFQIIGVSVEKLFRIYHGRKKGGEISEQHEQSSQAHPRP